MPSVGDGSGLSQGRVQVSTAIGGVATITVGTDTGLGSEISIRVSPAVAASALYAFGSDIGFNQHPTGNVQVSGSLLQGQTLTATSSLADADGLGSITYQWNANGQPIPNAIDRTVVLSESQVGKAITVVASYIDGHGTLEAKASAATAPVANVNDPPVGWVVVSGNPIQGQILTAAPTLTDADGLGVISYQWLANGSAIAGATSATILMTAAQVGKVITVNANYTDGHGHFESTTGGFSKSVTVLAYSWKQHTLLDGVLIQNVSPGGTTDANGTTTFASVSGSGVQFATARAISDVEATVTSSAVNLQDAIAIMKMIVGLPVNGPNQPLSPYQALAADFDGDGAIGLADAIGVLKHVVGLASPTVGWHFANEVDASIPGKASLTPGQLPAIIADVTGNSAVRVGLVGYLSGDVDASYSGASGAADLDVLDPAYFFNLVSAHPSLSLPQFGVYA